MNLFNSHPPVLITICRGPQRLVRSAEEGATTRFPAHVVVGVAETSSAALPEDVSSREWMRDYYDLSGVPLAGPNVYRTAAPVGSMSPEELYTLGRPAHLLIAKAPLYFPAAESAYVKAETLLSQADRSTPGGLSPLWARSRAPRAILAGLIETPVDDASRTGETHAGRKPSADGEGAPAEGVSRLVVELQLVGSPLPQQPLAVVYDRLPIEDIDAERRRGAGAGDYTLPVLQQDG